MRAQIFPQKCLLQNKNICCGLYDQQTAGVHYQGTIIFDVCTKKIESLVGIFFCALASSDYTPSQSLLNTVNVQIGTNEIVNNSFFRCYVFVMELKNHKKNKSQMQKNADSNCIILTPPPHHGRHQVHTSCEIAGY